MHYCVLCVFYCFIFYPVSFLLSLSPSFYVCMVDVTFCGRSIIIAGGLVSFAWAKNSVVKQRHELMRARQRMLRANDAEYESQRKFTG